MTAVSFLLIVTGVTIITALAAEITIISRETK